MSEGAEKKLNLVDVVDDLHQVRRRIGALRLCSVAIEMEGADQQAGRSIREIVDIIDDDLACICDGLDEARKAEAS